MRVEFVSSALFKIEELKARLAAVEAERDAARAKRDTALAEVTRFVRFENHAGEEICVNASYVIKVAPEMHTEYVVDANRSLPKRFHVAGRCYMIVAGLGDVFVLGTLDEVLAKLEGK